MLHSKGIWIILLAGLLLYSVAWSMASKGYGYAGYGARHDDNRGGYYGHRGPSFFYFGGANYYPNSSVRKGSTGGPGSFGQGPGSGK